MPISRRIRIALALAAITSGAIAVTPARTTGTIYPIAEPQKSPVEEIAIAAKRYGLNKQILVNLAMCESSMRHDGIYGDSGAAYGLMQFHQPTFDLFKKQAGEPNLSRERMADQVELTAWAIKNGLGHHWTCFRPKP